MKFICIRQSTIIIYTILIIVILISISFTYIITKNNYNNDIITEEIEDELEFICEDENNCEDSVRKELLIEQYNNKKLIALTFDDGPSKYTETLVD